MPDPNASPVEVFIDGMQWREVTSFAGVASNERVFRLNSETGELSFGDGVHGKPLPSGAEITIRYRTGRGAGGNNPRVLRPIRADEVRPFHRVRYFQGKLLSAEDLNAEQNYHRDKRRLQNRLLVPAGAISGRVSVGNNGFELSPGIAIDAHGNEIVVPSERLIPFPLNCDTAFVAISYLETPTDPVPASYPDGNGTECSRIEEGYTVSLLTENPDSDGFVVLGKFVNRAGRWTRANGGPSSADLPLALAAICLISSLLTVTIRCFGRVRERI